MKNIKFVSLMAASLMLTMVACTATPQRESTGQYVDDTVITSNVKTAILNEPSLKVNEITVETYKGTVQLSGFVRSQANIEKAISLARKVNGVVSVKNDMRLK